MTTIFDTVLNDNYFNNLNDVNFIKSNNNESIFPKEYIQQEFPKNVYLTYIEDDTNYQLAAAFDAKNETNIIYQRDNENDFWKVIKKIKKIQFCVRSLYSSYDDTTKMHIIFISYLNKDNLSLNIGDFPSVSYTFERSIDSGKTFDDITTIILNGQSAINTDNSILSELKNKKYFYKLFILYDTPENTVATKISIDKYNLFTNKIEYTKQFELETTECGFEKKIGRYLSIQMTSLKISSLSIDFDIYENNNNYTFVFSAYNDKDFLTYFYGFNLSDGGIVKYTINKNINEKILCSNSNLTYIYASMGFLQYKNNANVCITNDGNYIIAYCYYSKIQDDSGYSCILDNNNNINILYSCDICRNEISPLYYGNFFNINDTIYCTLRCSSEQVNIKNIYDFKNQKTSYKIRILYNGLYSMNNQNNFLRYSTLDENSFSYNSYVNDNIGNIVHKIYIDNFVNYLKYTESSFNFDENKKYNVTDKTGKILLGTSLDSSKKEIKVSDLSPFSSVLKTSYPEYFILSKNSKFIFANDENNYAVIIYNIMNSNELNTWAYKNCDPSFNVNCPNLSKVITLYKNYCNILSTYYNNKKFPDNFIETDSRCICFDTNNIMLQDFPNFPNNDISYNKLKNICPCLNTECTTNRLNKYQGEDSITINYTDNLCNTKKLVICDQNFNLDNKSSIEKLRAIQTCGGSDLIPPKQPIKLSNIIIILLIILFLSISIIIIFKLLKHKKKN